MQDLANFQGVIPQTLTAGGGDLLPHPTPSPAFGRARGAWDPNIETSQFFSRGCAPAVTLSRPISSVTL